MASNLRYSSHASVSEYACVACGREVDPDDMGRDYRFKIPHTVGCYEYWHRECFLGRKRKAYAEALLALNSAFQDLDAYDIEALMAERDGTGDKAEELYTAHDWLSAWLTRNLDRAEKVSQTGERF